MRKAPPKRAKKQPPRASFFLSPVLREGALFIYTALAVYLLVALATYHPDDPSWLDTGKGEVRNAAGMVGAGIADLLKTLVGHVAYLIPLMLGYYGWLVYSQGAASKSSRKDAGGTGLARWAGFLVTLLAACALLGIFKVPWLEVNMQQGAGGWIGLSVGGMFVEAFSDVGAAVLLLALLLTGITLWTNFSWLRAVDWVGKVAWNLGAAMAAALRWVRNYSPTERPGEDAPSQPRKRRKRRTKPSNQGDRIEPKINIWQGGAAGSKPNTQQPLFGVRGSKELPPLDLLDMPVESATGYSKESLSNMSKQIEMTMEDFKVDVTVVEAASGPVVTRFDLEPGAGVRGSKISGYAKDLARALSVASVRVEEVVEGRSVIGLEVPNEDREMVLASEILGSGAFNNSSSMLTLALGKDISGKPVVCDLSSMPHLLVAGTTGSGKSVAINGMIMSLLYKALPVDLRLILVDPKMLELEVYKDIPHLLTPVITDMNQAAQALLWCVGEMERRYTLMSKLGVRNLNGYNRKIKEASEPVRDPTLEGGAEGEDAPTLDHLPHIVVVIDEFADMMMTVGKKVEGYIVRLAQKARAAGIHLVLATQRPSREVITGLIKSNIPSRIAFRVASSIDSRIILDQGGADQLLGHGDMLFSDAGAAPRRVHGAFISDDEVRQVTRYLREHGGEPNYLPEVTEKSTSVSIPGLTDDGEGDGGEDPLYQEAVNIVVRDRKASVSYLQRRLKVGYNRAARLIEEMEAAQIVGGVQSGGTREVLAPPLDES